MRAVLAQLVYILDRSDISHLWHFRAAAARDYVLVATFAFQITEQREQAKQCARRGRGKQETFHFVYSVSFDATTHSRQHCLVCSVSESYFPFLSVSPISYF
jgi:hypothetical protein